MKSRFIGASILASIAILLTLTQNCDNVRLSLVQQPTVYSKVDGEICTLPPAAVNSVTKIIFLVDQSGSNNTTDPGKTYRYNVIKSFVDKHKIDPNTYWSFVVFGSPQGAEKATALINNGSDQTAIFSNAAPDIDLALTTFNGSQDTGNTPWHKAIDMAIAAIKADRAGLQAGVRAKYLAVLMTDGEPTDTEYGGQGMLSQTAIDNDAKRFPDNQAELSTIYYGPTNPAPALRLEEMAQYGNGKFSNVNLAGQVPLDSLFSMSFAEPWVMKKFMVANLNAAPCDDGTMGADSDSDGICDKDELKYNEVWLNDPTYATFKSRMNGKKFDPQNRNSFHPAFNDLIFFKTITQGDLMDTTCSDTTDEDHDFLNVCEEKFLVSNSSSGATPAWTARMKTDSDPLNFDSDGDGIIDWLELMFERTSFAGLNYNSTSRLIDGFRMDEMISQYRNPRNPKNAEAYDGSLRFNRINSEGQSCYSYTQTVLPLYKTLPVTAAQVSGNPDLAHGADESIVMIYFIQTPQSDPNGSGEMRYTFQKMKVGQPVLNLDLKVDNYRSYSATKARSAQP